MPDEHSLDEVRRRIQKSLAQAIRIEGMFSHFEATTPEYDVQMWVDIFVTDLFGQGCKDFLAGLEKQSFNGARITFYLEYRCRFFTFTG